MPAQGRAAAPCHPPAVVNEDGSGRVAEVTLRISTVTDFSAHEHTIIGFKVPDVTTTVKALREKGVSFNVYEQFKQDELGILTLPGGTLRVAWFKDPDSNVLSVTNA